MILISIKLEQGILDYLLISMTTRNGTSSKLLRGLKTTLQSILNDKNVLFKAISSQSRIYNRVGVQQ